MDETPTRRSVERTYGEALLQFTDSQPLSDSNINIAEEVLKDSILQGIIAKYFVLVKF